MKTIPLKQFTANLQRHGGRAVNGRGPMKVCDGEREFIVQSVDDWQTDQNTIKAFHDPELVRDLNAAAKSRAEGTGYYLTKEETDALLSI